MLLRDVDVRDPFFALAPARALEIGDIVVERRGSRRERELRAGFEQAIPELVVFMAAQRRVEPADALEQLASHRAVAAQEVGVREAMPGLPHPIEHRLPPGSQGDSKPIALRIGRKRQVAHHHPRGGRPLVRLEVGRHELRHDGDVVVQEDDDGGARGAGTGVSRHRRARFGELDHPQRIRRVAPSYVGGRLVE